MSIGWMSWAVMTGVIGLLIGAAAAYFRRWTMRRPPIGVFRTSDVMTMTVILVVAPLVYLKLPGTAVAIVFGSVGLGAVQLMLAPVLGGRVALLVAGALCVGAYASWSSHHPLPTWVLSDAVLALAVIGVANVWVQGGMRAGQVAGFAMALAAYDLAATTLTDVTRRFADHVQGLPFAPVFVLGGGHTPLSIGLGDLVMLTVFPLAMAKAFGRAAGVMAASADLFVSGVTGVLFVLGTVTSAMPLLTVLGPVIALQWMAWRRAGRVERPVVAWRNGAATAPVERRPLPTVQAAAALAIPVWVLEGEWMAVDGERVVGIGASPGLARKAAREGGFQGVPVVRQA